MSIGNAIKFIKLINGDTDFRVSLYDVSSWEELKIFLEKNDLKFTDLEYEDAFNHLHVQCQTVEQADALRNVNHFIRMLY